MNTIQEMRVESNFTQEEVARELNIDRSTVAKWETGKANPRAEMLVKLARLFGCSIDALMTSDVT